MQQWRRFLGGSLFLGALVALTVTLTACGDDMYASCDLDEASLCGDPEASVSCVEEQNLQCDTQICARYSGSPAFCTTTCQSDGDCVGGKCRQFPFGSETSYCVEETNL